MYTYGIFFKREVFMGELGFFDKNRIANKEKETE